MVWACSDKRGTLGLPRKEGDGNESKREKEERKTEENMVEQSEG